MTKRQLKARAKNLRKGAEKSWTLPRTEKQLQHVRKLGKKFIHVAHKAQKKKNGFCKICGFWSFLYKDHNHKTGERRGELCGKCNMGLGCFNDDLGLLRKALRYLEKYR